MSGNRERRAIPSIMLSRSTRKSGYERQSFWHGDLIRFTTPWVTLSIDYRNDYQMMADMIGDLKARQEAKTDGN